MTGWKKREMAYHASNPDIPASVVSIGPEANNGLIGLLFPTRVRMPARPDRGPKNLWHCSKLFTFKTPVEARACHQQYLGLRRMEALDKEPEVPFKIGDFVTGTNGSYARSIYKYAGLAVTPENKGGTEKEGLSPIPLVGTVGAHLQFFALKDTQTFDNEFWDVYICADKVGALYRLATEEEIKEAQNKTLGV